MHIYASSAYGGFDLRLHAATVAWNRNIVEIASEAGSSEAIPKYQLGASSGARKLLPFCLLGV